MICKYILQVSLKRDCPSEIFHKIQVLLHLGFFLFRHRFKELGHIHTSDHFFSFAVLGDMTLLSTAITDRRGPSRGFGRIDVHCVFVFYLYRYNSWFRLIGGGRSLGGFLLCFVPLLLFLLERFSFAVILFGVSFLPFEFGSSVVPFLEVGWIGSVPRCS